MKKHISFTVILLYLCIGLSAQQDSIIADSLYASAKDFYYDGQYETAQPLFAEALAAKKKFYGPEHEEIVWNYRRLGLVAEELRDYQTAFVYYDSALTLATRLKGPEDEIIADLLFDVAYAHASVYQVRKAQEKFNRSLEIYEKTKGKESVAVAEVLTQMGNNCISAGDYYTAEEYLERALAIFRQQLKPGAREFYPVFAYLSYLNRKIENFDQALEYAQRALDIKLKNYEASHPSVAKYYRNIGRIYQVQGAYQKAFPYFQRALEIAEQALGPNHPSTGGQYGEMGNILADLGRYDEAIAYIERANRVRSRYQDTLHPLVIAGDHNLAMVYRDKGDYVRALSYHQKGLRKYLKRDYPPPIDIVKTYRNISRVYEETDRPQEGLRANREAFRWLAPDFTPATTDDFRETPDLSQVRSPVDYLNALEDRAYLLRQWFEQDTSQLNRLAQALNSLEKSVGVVENLRRRYDSDAAREYLNENRSGLFELGIQTAVELYHYTDDPQYLRRAFELSEKSRASILWQSLQENIALQGAGIDPSFLAEMDRIGEEIRRLEMQLLSWQETPGKQKEIAAIERSLFEANLTYEAQINLLEQSNPRYYRLKYADVQLDWEDLENRLHRNQQTLLEYFYDDEQLYIFLVQETGIHVKKQVLPPDFPKWIRLIRNQKVNQLLSEGTEWRAHYLEALYQLYDLLLAPVEQELAATDRLLIVPYGLLQYLPFGILTPDQGGADFRKQQYLIKTHSVQYAWSVYLLQQSVDPSVRYAQDYLGFAPEFNQSENSNQSPQFAFRSQLTALTFNQREVEEGQKYYTGTSLVGDRATEPAFHQLAPRGRILHLATHTLVDDERPLRSGLVFSETSDSLTDGFLSVREIYDLNLPAELAIMSACNTGFGRLAKGEGVLSLGRAFGYAGCRSILMSLWLSNDQSTATLMDHFYRHLATGKTKDEALRRAKLDYLETADALMAHPYFWGGMVMIGEEKGVEKQTSFLWSAIWIMTILIVISLIYKGIRKLRAN